LGHIHGLARSSRGRLRIAALLVSASLSALFVLVYGVVNWVTSLRRDVGAWYFGWEAHIPFVGVMIVPYMSIDLFFVAAPFLCRDMRELRVFAQRIVLAIVAAGACFLLMPLQFAFDRPHAHGWLGALFDAFRALDRPHNLFPSLHIALGMILAVHYGRHTRGIVRAAVLAWFILVGASAVLTYQHHVIDVLGGIALAGYCFYCFREYPPESPPARNTRVAAYYGAGAFVIIPLFWQLRPWGAFLLWPAISLAIMTAAYLGVGPRVFRKEAGRLPLSSRFVLAPVLLGQHLSLLYYRGRCEPWSEVAPGVWMGRKLNNRDAARAVRAGVTAVLDLTAEFVEAAPFRAISYHNVPTLDLTAPSVDQLRRAVAVVAQHAASGAVYVHCKIGYSRSAAVVGAYLLASGRADSVDRAIAQLRQVRPTIILRSEAVGALRNAAVLFRPSEAGAPAAALHPGVVDPATASRSSVAGDPVARPSARPSPSSRQRRP
jgi:protein-tyrosine phosphatase/membrane-associated phospholipid phosphatase